MCPTYVSLEMILKQRYLNPILSNLELPLIVKPTGLAAASILVNKVAPEIERRETLKESFSTIHELDARDAGRWEPEMIIEEFMEGEMYSRRHVLRPDRPQLGFTTYPY